MLELYLSGYGYSKKLCRNAVEWFYDTYLKRYKITLEVLHKGLKSEGVWGWCSITGRTTKPREFLIELDVYMEEELYLKVLFHELVHLMDFCKGDLKLKSSKRYYKGECMEDLGYNQQPHEIYALHMEEVLYKEYIKQKKNHK